MKKYLIAAGMIVLMGGGCAAQTDGPEIDTTLTEREAKMEVKEVAAPSATIEAVVEAELLPKDEEWNQVQIKNFGRSYTVEIHPWWHWDATSVSLEGDGARFANSKDVMLGSNTDGAQYRVLIKGGETKNASALADEARELGIESCDVYEGDFEGFQLCLGSTTDNAFKGVALQNDGAYEWMITLAAASDKERAQGYFLHMLETFTEL